MMKEFCHYGPRWLYYGSCFQKMPYGKQKTFPKELRHYKFYSTQGGATRSIKSQEQMGTTNGVAKREAWRHEAAVMWNKAENRCKR